MERRYSKKEDRERCRFIVEQSEAGYSFCSYDFATSFHKCPELDASNAVGTSSLAAVICVDGTGYKNAAARYVRTDLLIGQFL